jgi:hypothetical protein
MVADRRADCLSNHLYLGLRPTVRLFLIGASRDRYRLRIGQCGGGVFVALAGEQTEHTGKHVSRRAAASNFTRPIRIDSWP